MVQKGWINDDDDDDDDYYYYCVTVVIAWASHTLWQSTFTLSFAQFTPIISTGRWMKEQMQIVPGSHEPVAESLKYF